MKGRVGVAILGTGYWGVNYVRNFNELLDSEVLAVCDQRTQRLAEISRRFPGIFVTDSLDAMLAYGDVEAVVIATGATSHYSLATRCIAAGKHVLIEKPLTTDPGEAAELIRLAERHRVKLMVGHTFLYNAAVKALKEHMHAQDVGEIYYLYSCRTNLGPIRHDVNALWDLAPHDVAIFNYLLDSTPAWVSAVGTKVLKNQREDVGFVTLGYANNVIGHIHVSWADPNKVRELVVVGSNKRIVFDDLNIMEPVRIFEKGISAVPPASTALGGFQYETRDGNIVSPHIQLSEPLKNQCQHFLDCIVHDCQPRTDGHAGLEVVQVMAAIDRSIANQGAPVAVEEISYDSPDYSAFAA